MDIGSPQPPREEPSGKPGEATAERRHVRIPLRWIVFAALLVVFAAPACWLGWTAVQRHEQNIADSQAVEAAKKYVLLLSNIDSGTVDANFTELYESSTKEFNDTHATRGAELRTLLIDKKISSRGDIVDVSIASGAPGKVVVEVLVDQSVTNVDAPDPQKNRSRISITMEKVSGKWLTSDIKLL